MIAQYFIIVIVTCWFFIAFYSLSKKFGESTNLFKK